MHALNIWLVLLATGLEGYVVEVEWQFPAWLHHSVGAPWQQEVLSTLPPYHSLVGVLCFLAVTCSLMANLVVQPDHTGNSVVCSSTGGLHRGSHNGHNCPSMYRRWLGNSAFPEAPRSKDLQSNLFCIWHKFAVQVCFEIDNYGT